MRETVKACEFGELLLPTSLLGSNKVVVFNAETVLLALGKKREQ